MRESIRRMFAFLMIITLIVNNSVMLSASETGKVSEVLVTSDEYVPEFSKLSDPDLLQYIEDEVYAGLEKEFQSEDYIIENVSAVYYSKEYLAELEYNSKENIWFGYNLNELLDQFQGEKFIFTLGDDDNTLVTAFQDYDDTYEKVLRNVAIGTGVILVCVTVSVVTAGSAAPISMVFAASAKQATIMALSSGGISTVFAGAITGIQTGDMKQAIKAGALAGSESFKWGAIGGAITGGAGEALRLHRVPAQTDDLIVDTPVPDSPVDDIVSNIVDDVVTNSPVDDVIVNNPVDDVVANSPVDDVVANSSVDDIVMSTPADDIVNIPVDEFIDASADSISEAVYIDNPNIPAWRNAELRALSRYGGSEQVTYLNGIEVPFGTPGATRPDVVTMVGDHLEAIEVKYYNFESPSCLNTMYSELEREVAARVANLPPDATQRVVLDVTGRNFTEDLVKGVSETVKERLFNIYPDIPVDIVGFAS